VLGVQNIPLSIVNGVTQSPQSQFPRKFSKTEACVVPICSAVGELLRSLMTESKCRHQGMLRAGSRPECDFVANAFNGRLVAFRLAPLSS
jgi:hypothetical protein